ncbi:MAG: SRPBCC family protein [Flavobacteriaceae bacterium]
MKVLKYILFILLIAVIGTCIYIAVQPNSFKLSRSITINAPSEVIYNNVIDFKNWSAWSAWVEENPTIRLNFPEQTSGVNGSYSWNDADGTGSMTTTSATPFANIQQEMRYGDYPASQVNWNFTPNTDGSTTVTWSMSGDNLPFGFKAFTAFSGGVEQQIGPQYERSLKKLDSIVVASMKVYSITVNGTTDHSGGYYLYNTSSCKVFEVSKKVQDMMPELFAYARANNISTAGNPFIHYIKWDVANDAAIFSCGLPTTEKIITTNNDILTGQLPAFKAVKTTLTGDYVNLSEAWNTAMAYVKAQGFVLSEEGPMLEVGKITPKDTPNPAKWVTEIYLAIKQPEQQPE